jgi:phosphotriesterase-related protein
MQRLTRRSWLAGLAGAAPVLTRWRQAPVGRPVQTVTGQVDAASLGVTLMHEHVLVDFIGAARASRSRYDPDEVARDPPLTWRPTSGGPAERR